jgi:hypothetical protein
MVTVAYGWAVASAESLPAVHGTHEPWRYTLMSGIIPAIPLIFIRPFLPESPKWIEAKRAGTLKRPSIAKIFEGDLRRTTIVTTLMVACSYAAAFGAIQHVPRIVPSLPELQGLERPVVEQAVKDVQLWQEIGGLIGRALLAILAVRILSRRLLIRGFQIPGIIPSSSSVRRRVTWACSSGASCWSGSAPLRSSASGGTTSRWSIRSICAAPARASQPTSAVA